ncbi:unnamed protein product [Dovyalis caffra]|uniref:Uncharacterized protein n=1 Tax=Dovyalis caffra TaxID=77055 RepID=A0AAV1S6S0_9ROSI|nr:unnamed protein product [Dovyalis caffra]
MIPIGLEKDTNTNHVGSLFENEIWTLVARYDPLSVTPKAGFSWVWLEVGSSEEPVSSSKTLERVTEKTEKNRLARKFADLGLHYYNDTNRSRK